MAGRPLRRARMNSALMNPGDRDYGDMLTGLVVRSLKQAFLTGNQSEIITQAYNLGATRTGRGRRAMAELLVAHFGGSVDKHLQYLQED